jgi:NitT/TauT family transport system substrate-binding protein
VHHLKTIRTIGVLCVAWLGAAGCASADRRAAARAPLSFAFDLWAGYFPAVIAKSSGIYDSLGITVELRRPGNTGALLADFAAGRHDLVGVSFADVVTLSNSMPSLRVVMCSDESAGADAVVATPSIATMAQLKGRRIGVRLGGFAELFVTTALRQHGVDPKQVRFVDADAADVPALLASGRIDAGETWDPYLARARDAGARVLFSTTDTPGLIVDCIATRSDVLMRRGDDVRRFVDGWFRALDRWRADSAGGRALVARELGIPLGDAGADGVRLLNLAENRRRFHGNDADAFLKVADTYSQFFSQLGALRAPFRATTVLTADYLPK